MTSDARAARRFNARLAAGIALLSAGVLLIGAAGAYYTYTYLASRNMDRLIVSAPDVLEPLDTLVAAPPQITTPTPLVAGRPPPASQQLYPGSLIPARQWANPRGTLDLEDTQIEGFTPVSALGRASIVGQIGRADQIAIPALGIDAAIVELAIEELANSTAYETPKFTVGHIPESPNPGSHGNGWYFGHLDSPIQGEGNIFARLPQVPELLRNGEDVHLILQSGNHEYLYQVSETDLIHQDDMRLYQAGDARVTLVTCYPRLRYDHRLLITAKLVGFRNLATL